MNYKLITSILLPLSVTAFGQKDQKPNVIFFLMDDMGYSEIGVMGQQKIETPNIDALANSGKILTQHYSGSPVSAPSRCVLLTSLHTGHSQIRGNDEDGKRGNVWSHQAMFDDPKLEGQKPMDGNTRTMAHAFQDAGYATACIGKWGLGAPGSDSEPNKMGFDKFFGYNCQRLSHTYYPTHLYDNTQRVLLNNKVLQPATKLAEGADPYDKASYARYQQNDFAPDLMFDQTIKFIDKNKDNPFFIWWTTPLPHVPLQAPERLIEKYVAKFGDEEPYIGNHGYFPCRYPRATYAAMITYVDEQIGAIVDKLKKDGIYENTIIVFTSDNGPSFAGGTQSPWFDSAKPFKSEQGWGKTSVQEGGLRVPTFVVWDGKIKKGTTDNTISAFQDWMPTFMDMIGQKKLITENIDGLSLKPILTGKGKQKQHDYLYWEFPEQTGDMAVRSGDWKMIVKGTKKEPKYFLFNIQNDPREQTNLAENNPEKLEELKQIAIKAHIAPTNPNFKMGLPLS